MRGSLALGSLALAVLAAAVPMGKQFSLRRSGGASHFTSRAAQKGDEQLEAWEDSGLAVSTTLKKETVDDVAASISKDSFDGMLHKVSSPSSRFVADKGNLEAAEFIRGHLADLGFDVHNAQVAAALEQQTKYSTTEKTFQAPGNIVGFLQGTDLKDELVIFGAHFDSVNWEDTSAKAPGVDDNGSGAAAVLLAAEAVKKQHEKKPLRRSVAFVAFQAEEEGLLGSKEFVSGPIAQGEYGKPVAVVIADEVAYGGRPNHADQVRKAIFETKGKNDANTAIVDTLAHAAKSEDVIKGFEVNYHGFGSDHISFLDAGYPAVLLIEHDDEYHADTWGHSARDTFEHVDTEFGAAMTRLATRAVLALASPKKT